jgi:hypothetical protein
MSEYFECMRCGHTSLVSAKPPKCPKCGSGAGVIETKQDPPAKDAGPGAPRKDGDPPK